MVEHADVNVAKNILAAGLAVAARGDFGVARSLKRESLGREVAYVTVRPGIPWL